MARWGTDCRRPSALGVAVAVMLSGCPRDPAGPEGLRLDVVAGVDAELLIGAPGRALREAVTLRAVTLAGEPVPGATVRWTTSGTGSSVAPGAAVTGPDGILAAVWVLGTRAEESQQLRADVYAADRAASVVLRATARPSEVAALEFPGDTVTVKLGAAVRLSVDALDPFGNRFRPDSLAFMSLDTTVVHVDTDGWLEPSRRGHARVVASSRGATDTVWIHATQVVRAIEVTPDTLRFRSLGQVVPLGVALRDDQGLVVSDSLPAWTIADTAVVDRVDSVTVRSRRNGVTTASFTVDGLTGQVVLHVEQVADTVLAELASAQRILTLPLGARIPLTCEVRDRNGFPMSARPTVTSAWATVSDGVCDTLIVRASGHDTLTVSASPATITLPIVVAVAPIPSGPVGELMVADSFPSVGDAPWAPSARRNSAGVLEVYAAVFSVPADSTGVTRAHLHRFASRDGVRLRYDGVAVEHDEEICSPQGEGVENMIVVPRADGPGWRMFYAAGSNACWGWQVFSAVSPDERTWTKEPGVRIWNGATQPRAPSAEPYPPWPAGEGMWIDQLPSGVWRMIVAAHEPTHPPQGKWQILEWRSPDQIEWHYHGPVLTTRDLPPEAQGGVYSPTLRRIAPNLWRMVFAAYNREHPDGRGRVWSAVSTDLATWQDEGELLGAPGVDIYYAAWVDDHVVFVRVEGGVFRLASAVVRMP